MSNKFLFNMIITIDRKIKRKSRSRSRSKGKDKDSKYVTSNTRATVPVKLEGEDAELASIKVNFYITTFYIEYFV